MALRRSRLLVRSAVHRRLSVPATALDAVVYLNACFARRSIDVAERKGFMLADETNRPGETSALLTTLNNLTPTREGEAPFGWAEGWGKVSQKLLPKLLRKA